MREGGIKAEPVAEHFSLFLAGKEEGQTKDGFDLNSGPKKK